MSTPPPPQVSPDGRYYWDGSQWVPTALTSLTQPTQAPSTTRRAPAAEVGCLPKIGVSVLSVIVILGLGAYFTSRLPAPRPEETVGYYFDSAPSSRQWMDAQGVAVPPEVISTAPGSAKCGLESVTFLTFFGRQYIRDPLQKFPENGSSKLLSSFWITRTLPRNSMATGYRFGPVELYVMRDSQDRVFLSASDKGQERWPRVDPVFVCT